MTKVVIMNSLRNKLSNRKLMQNGLVHLQSYSTPASSSTIQIPNRKERSPTDILKALESTIRRDLTAPHYKYIDDPHLIPLSNLEKRSYALAKEAGKKAAMWIRKEHADLFQHKEAEPMIDAFAPRAVYTDKTKVSEETLLNVIKSANVSDSLQIYNLLEGNVKIETKLALFEMLCFTNSNNAIDDDLIEERWFTSANQNAWSSNTTWKETAEKDELFKTLVEAGGDIAVAAYNAWICGHAKFKNLFKAWEIYLECREKQIPINQLTYTYLIPIVVLLKRRDDDRQAFLVELYKEMAENNLKPDVRTLNASVSLTAKMERNRNLFQNIFNEFKRIDVNPSLGTYYHYLQCFAKTPSFIEPTLKKVLDSLYNKEFTLEDPTDQKFFVLAMTMAHNCNSLSLGQKLHSLLLKDNNYLFIGDSYQENVYYRYYMLLHLNTLDFDSFMEIYQEFIPNVYTPEPMVFGKILDSLKEQNPESGSETLKVLFSHAIMYDFIRSVEILGKIMSLMCEQFKPPTDSPLIKVYAENAWSAYNQMLELKSTSRRGYNFYADIMEKMAVLCVRGDEFDHMLEILSILVNGKNQVLGAMTPNYLNELFEACLARGHAEACLSLVDYAIECGMNEGITLGTKAYSTLSLSVAQENRLETLVGKDVLKVKSSKKES